MEEKDGLQRRQVVFSGMVQGVGFRYTTWRIAAQFSVLGYVRNESDGRVSLVMEGRPEELDRFLAAISREMGHYIDDLRQTTQPATGEFARFEIRH